MPGMGAAAVILIRQNRCIRRYQEAGAVRPGAARAPADVGVPQDRALRRLVACGVLVDAGDGRLYLDQPAAVEFLRARRRRVWLLAVLTVFAFALGYLIWQC